MSEPTPPKQDSSSFLLIFVFMITIMVMFDNNLRMGLGGVVGAIFYPVIGFEGEFPVLTLLLAGLTMTAISVLIRHKFMDWVSMTKNQKVMGAFNKELREARMAGDQVRMDKLMKIQKTLMADQMQQSSSQMKPMVFSMLIIISIFAWVNMFLVGDIGNKTFSIPWAFNVSLERYGPVWQIMPVWIGIYSLVSVPLGQVVQKILKEVSFKKRLRLLEEEEFSPKQEAESSEYEEEVEDEEDLEEVDQDEGEEVDEEEGEEAEDEIVDGSLEEEAESVDDTGEEDSDPSDEIVSPKAVGE